MNSQGVPTVGDRIRGCLLGLAVGDAVGTTVEFCPRGQFAPVTDLVGGGPFQLTPGQWTDDTSMALCLACSLLEQGRFDPQDQMDRYQRWYRQGYLSSTGQCFDIGNTVREALETYERTGNPFSGSTDPRRAGNGCLMRLAPVVLAYWPQQNLILHYAAESARTTHGATECLEASRLLAALLWRALMGLEKSDLLAAADLPALSSPGLGAIAQGTYRDKAPDQIKSNGYVVTSLEAALWCFWHADSYREAVLMAANLGDDADTTAAICGQLAGAYYGATGIPASWLGCLTLGVEIGQWATALGKMQPQGASGWDRDWPAYLSRWLGLTQKLG